MEKHSFIDIFTKKVEDKDINKIIIPKIQRDYAQGRDTADIVRKNFLHALRKAIEERPITLDFIYGDISNDGKFIPLDGQQRLTTLFLIHWYASRKENIDRSESEFLTNFSYETRMSSREFCKSLIKRFEPNFNINKKLSLQIENQTWFPDEWLKDPTVKSMLNMIDSIHEEFKDVNNIWNKLKNDSITFYVLTIDDIGLTDDIYIKMNSRGRPLTEFENFKAELNKTIGEIDNESRNRISRKIDNDWTALFWYYRDSKKYIDDKFMNFFNFIFDVLCFENHFNKDEMPDDAIEKIYIFFSDNSKEEKFKRIDCKKSIELMENYFDVLYRIFSLNGGDMNNYFNRFLSTEHHEGKSLYKDKEENLFVDCIKNYGKEKTFTNGKFILLYTFINYELIKNVDIEKNFPRRLRIINNLVLNSMNELRTKGVKKNKILIILEEVKKILESGVDRIDLNEDKTGFNTKQLIEEKKKLEWTENHHDIEESLFRLEDSEYLRGRIEVIGIDNYELFDRFNQLFKCDKEKISCALLSIGKYGLKTKHGDKIIYHFGKNDNDDNETSWSKIFRTLDDESMKMTKSILNELLRKSAIITNEYLETIINNYLEKCLNEKLFDWRYYFIKYEKIRNSRYGTYYWKNEEEKPYEFYLMTTPTHPSEFSYNAFLCAIGDMHIPYSYDTLELENHKIVASNDAFEIDGVRYPILQENGIDKEDRIVKLKQLLNM